MGLKHSPNLIVRAALGLRDRPNDAIVVVSEGVGADYLQNAKREHDLGNLLLLPYQPIALLPQLLGSADVLTAFLEPSAGMYSVPSKLLTYLCAGRPVLLAVPAVNLAARTVSGCNLGVVVEPEDIEGYVQAAASLLNDVPAQTRFGMRARRYAEETFDIARIAETFEMICSDAIGTMKARRGRS